MASQRSLDPILEEARAERLALSTYFEGLDSKAGILLVFSGALAALAPMVGHPLVHTGRFLSVGAALLALSAFWPRSFPVFDLGGLRELYLAADPAFTLVRILDSHIAMIEALRAVLERKARRLRISMTLLASSALLTATGLVVR